MTSLKGLQDSLNIKYGSFDEELDEQKMSYQFLVSDDKVLELGSNIGRNSLIISKILTSSENLITLEMDTIFYKKCIENRDNNNLNFHCINKALSYSPLYSQLNKKHGEGGGYCVQHKYNEDYIECHRVTLEELEKEYNIKFNVLVCDCEGGLYYILKDNPNLFENMNKIILENDFSSIEHKKFVDNILIKYGFQRVFVEKLLIGNFPCKEFFWETWTR